MSVPKIIQAEIVHEDIEGAKGGGGAQPPELPNTLASRAKLRLLVLVSEGPIQGIPGGPKGIYINDTPLQNADGSFNFNNIEYDWRVGYPDQAKVNGFMEAASTVDVGAVLTTSTPVIRESSDDTIDAMKVVINLPTGLMWQLNGTLYPTNVDIQIDRKLSTAGTWETVIATIIGGKTDSATQREYRVPRPAGEGKWQYRVRRITGDSTTSSLRNDTSVAYHVEYQDIDNNYPNCAYIAIGIDAESVNGQIPNIAFLIKGLTVKVPTNYDPETRGYSGTFWDGTFKNAWTDNPAWILYDLLTNTRYGMGARGITESMVDRFSFYDAGRYCDGLVPDGKGGYEPRFTFNYPINTRDDAWNHIMMIAGAMHSTIIQSRGQIRVNQDRPADPYMIVSKANVYTGEDGSEPPFTYKGTALSERPTQFNITYADRENRHEPTVISIDDPAAISKYGLALEEQSAYGATTEGQAIRHGKWAVYSSQHQTEVAQWRMGMNGADLEPGHIVILWDEDYTDEAGAGRVVSATSSSVVLDRPVAITGSSTLTVMLADGVTLATFDVFEGAGTYTTLNINGVFPQTVLPMADYFVSTAVDARQFRVTSVLQEEDIFNIEAVSHDPAKYNWVEFGVAIPARNFTDSEPTICSAPTSLTVRESIISDNNQLSRQLLVSWFPPSVGKVAGYTISYRRTNEEWATGASIQASFNIPNVVPGEYEIRVAATSIFGLSGPQAVAIYNIDTSGGAVSPMNPVVELKVADNGSTTEFPGRDLNISFRNPSSNASVPSLVVRDFQVSILDADTGDVIRSTYIPSVPPGILQGYTYLYSDNLADGGPHRQVKVSVRCRDSNNNLTSAAEITVQNPPPAFVEDFEVTSGIARVNITHKRPTDSDYVGMLIWRGDTSTFSVGTSNLLFIGDSTFFSDTTNLSPGAEYYYKIAAYDDFGYEADFSDLNISVGMAGTAFGYPGVAGGDTFPANPQDGDSFYRTDEGVLYFYNATAEEWEPAGVNSGTSLPATGVDGQEFLKTPDNVLYIWRDGAGAWVPVTPADGTITTGKLVAGAVTTAKLAAGAVTANEIAASAVTAGKLDANSVATANLQAGVITTDKIGANQVTTAKVAAGAITANEIGAGAITTVKLAAGSVTADKASITQLSALSANMGTITAGEIISGSIRYGSYGNGYAWPATGNGFFLGPGGLLMGNPNTGGYFQIESSTGNVYAPNFSVINGNATFNGNITGSSGTFYGNLGAAGVISAANIPSGLITQCYAAGTGGTSTSVSFYVPAGSPTVYVVATTAAATGTIVAGGGKDTQYYTTVGPAYCELYTPWGMNNGYGCASFAVGYPAAGSYSITVNRALPPGASWGGFSGNMYLCVFVANK